MTGIDMKGYSGMPRKPGRVIIGMIQMMKEPSPPPNKPFHRVGGERHPPPVNFTLGASFANEMIA
jgi:hypothetical protein